MTSFTARSGRLVLWIIVTAMVSLAIAVTALRVALPRLDRFQVEITELVEELSGLPFEIGEVKGYWRNTHPFISLTELNVQSITDQNIMFDIDEVELEFDLIQSILTLEPQIATLNVKGLQLDISNVNLFKSTSNDSGEATVTTQKHSSLKQIEKLFFRQLKDFKLLDSMVVYQTYDGESRVLDIEQLQWQNRADNHKLEGLVSVVGSHINSLAVKADFQDNGSIRDLSGDFYLQAKNIRVSPWLTSEWIKETGIQSGYISFNSWFSVKNNHPIDAYVELLPSELVWQNEEEHVLMAEEGIFKLVPFSEGDGWKVSGHSLRVRSDEYEWPSIDLAFEYTPDKWIFNASQLDISSLKPLAALVPNADEMNEWLARLQPSGLIEDIRLSQSNKDNSLSYSASLSSGGMQQWELLPEVHDVSATISGNEHILSAHVTLIDDVLPYGDVFQAPLKIKNGEVDIVWEMDDEGWRLWADKISVATPDLQAQGAFRLDFPKESAAFLSLYAEADLYNGGEVWRYLPTRALGQELTNYLSTAIQGGKANNAKIIWYGPLNTFPYRKHDGIFQAQVALTETKFSFDTRWPTITDMQLNLLFENESMYLDSRSATLNDVKAERVTGKISHLGPSGAVEINAKASGKGQAVRDYMMATPLVNSVGAALTAVKVSGDVRSEFQLKIPFNTKVASRAWGYADLKNNHIHVETPPMDLENATGRITFDNDIVRTSGLSANLLKQPISVDFKGESLHSSYSVGIDILGDWDVKPLEPYLGAWTNKVKGHAPWNMDVDLQLNDVGFTYQVDTSANLEFISSQYPAPLTKALGKKSKLTVQASGNQEKISARLQLPDVKYQTEIDITKKTPVLQATNLFIGKGGFKVSPIIGHNVTIRIPSFDLDSWLSVINEKSTSKQKSHLSEMNMPKAPSLHRVDILTDRLTFATLDWNDVNFNARKKNLSWLLNVDSAEVKGQANYLEPYDLSVSLDRLHVFLPSLSDVEHEVPVFKADTKAPLISEFDKSFHQLMPNLTLKIDDLWLQGYKVGKVNVDLQRKGKRLNWNNININSGRNQIKANGWWELTKKSSKSSMELYVQGENNTELMERFGISSGIQKAPFEMTSKLSWNGAPWSLQVDTLDGDIKAKFGKGIISGAGSAAKFLGMFSLDSIIKKMQLDFTDVFDDGLAFSSITGSGKMEKGIFITNDLEMDATAGEMLIRGMADLNKNQVDAEVEFTPDLTSGIPVLTAFAVAPQTAIVVFAISTVISPVVDVFTKIRYQIVGPLDSPVVKELSRSKGEYTLPNTKSKKGK